MKTRPAVRHGAREAGVFGEEAVAGMDRLGAGLFGGLEDPFGLEIALGGGRRSDGDRVVGLAHVQRGAIGLRIDRDRLDAQVAAGADHAHGDLAAIRNQDSLEHRLR